MTSSQNKIRDLSIFCLQISSFYKSIYNIYIKRYPKSFTKNWISLFSTLSYSPQTQKKLEKVLTDIGMNLADFYRLQEIRKMRNAFCHPRVRASTALSIAKRSWTKHDGYSALEKMLEFMCIREKLYEESNSDTDDTSDDDNIKKLKSTITTSFNTTKKNTKIEKLTKTNGYVLPNLRETYVPRLLLE